CGYVPERLGGLTPSAQEFLRDVWLHQQRKNQKRDDAEERVGRRCYEELEQERRLAGLVAKEPLADRGAGPSAQERDQVERRFGKASFLSDRGELVNSVQHDRGAARGDDRPAEQPAEQAFG